MIVQITEQIRASCRDLRNNRGSVNEARISGFSILLTSKATLEGDYLRICRESLTKLLELDRFYLSTHVVWAGFLFSDEPQESEEYFVITELEG